MKVSICTPYHDTPNTAFYLSRLLKSLSEQTFKDYEVVLTKEGDSARNHNAAIMKAKGDIIQIIHMDDYFYGPGALQRIVDGFNDESVAWQISACMHNRAGEEGWLHIPEWTADIYTGNNHLGSPTTLSMRREQALLFEEPLWWLVDVELYYRLFLKYGLPRLNLTPNVVVDVRPSSLSNTLSSELKAKEFNYLMKKYGK